MKLGLVVRNVSDTTELLRQKRPLVQAWSLVALKAFLAVADDDHLYPATWYAAVTAGLQRGQLLGLRWQDVDLEHGTLHIRPTLVKTDEARACAGGYRTCVHHA